MQWIQLLPFVRMNAIRLAIKMSKINYDNRKKTFIEHKIPLYFLSWFSYNNNGRLIKKSFCITCDVVHELLCFRFVAHVIIKIIIVEFRAFNIKLGVKIYVITIILYPEL